jgi:hypothetical protein
MRFRWVSWIIRSGLFWSEADGWLERRDCSEWRLYRWISFFEFLKVGCASKSLCWIRQQCRSDWIFVRLSSDVFARVADVEIIGLCCSDDELYRVRWCNDFLKSAVWDEKVNSFRLCGEDITVMLISRGSKGCRFWWFFRGCVWGSRFDMGRCALRCDSSREKWRKTRWEVSFGNQG